MKDSKTKAEESTRLTYTGLCHSYCRTHLDVSVSERSPTSVGLRDVSEEGGDGEAACSETPSLLVYTFRYVSFAEVGSVCRI
jgi:hypothetical protein